MIADGLPSHSCFILPVPNSRRYFFVVPWKGKHLIGTTETEVGDYPRNLVLPKEEEIEELLALTRTFFPGQNPIVICTITGLRPLARSTKGSTITLSREHEFHQMEAGVFSAVGGKYTTHRTFAEQFLQFILGSKVLIKNIKPRLLPGAWNGEIGRANLETKLLAYPFVDAGICKAWMRRYGMRGLELAEFVATTPNGPDRLSVTDSVLYGEVRFAYEKEWAKTPTDFFRRRTDIYFTARAGIEMLAKVKAFFLRENPLLEKSLGLDADYTDFLKGNRHRAIL